MEMPKIVLYIVLLIISAGLIIFFTKEFLFDKLLSPEAGVVQGLFDQGKELSDELTGQLFKSFK